jgi:CheY-like chemotaxis protein
MRKLHSQRPVLGIALTGFGMEEDIRKSHDAGFRHHLVKPIDLNKLDSLIQESAATLSTRRYKPKRCRAPFSWLAKS